MQVGNAFPGVTELDSERSNVVSFCGNCDAVPYALQTDGGRARRLVRVTAIQLRLVVLPLRSPKQKSCRRTCVTLLSLNLPSVAGLGDPNRRIR
jgi:hypothetical protein